jgi:hypothetical protein
MFLFDGTAQAVAWATAKDAAFGRTTEQTQTALWEHTIITDPGTADGAFPPSNVDGYYSGASWTNTPRGTMLKDSAVIGDAAPLPHSSLGTFQLLSPARCPFIQGPFSEDHQDSVFSSFASILGSWGHTFRATFGIQSRSRRQLWHYRVASAQAFQANLEARLFLVVERYPFLAGTGYVNDVPEVGVFVIRPDGSVVRTLRPFQAGLAAASLHTGNAHRLFWTVSTPGPGPTLSYRYTDLDTGAESTLTPAQVTALLAGKARGFSPDFVWDRIDPQAFALVPGLPALVTDDVLADYARLLPADLPTEGDVRMVNDEELLEPLDRYRET